MISRPALALETTTTGRGCPDRIVGLAALAFFATLPLAWVTVASAGGGFIKPFHLAAFGLVVACLARWRPHRLIAPIWRRHVAVYGSYAVVLVAALSGGLVMGEPFLPRLLLARQAYYAGVSLVIAGFVVLAVGRRAQHWLAWAGVVTTAAVIGAFGVALARQGVNPFSIIAEAVIQANPDIITYRLLRSTFRSGDDLADVASNLRHKVFVGLLVAVFLGLAGQRCIAHARTGTRAVLGIAGVVGAAAVTLSLSRSTILCLVLTLGLYPLRILVRNRARPLQAVALLFLLLLGAALVVSPVGELLYTRFAATGSYESRLVAAGPSFFEDFAQAALIGTEAVQVEKSPHNFILHSWLAGGVVAATAACVLLAAIAQVWTKEAHRYLTGRAGWVVPVGQLWVLGLGIIPLVRSFTAGNQFHLVEWTSVGLFLGVTFANERRAAASPDQAQEV